MTRVGLSIKNRIPHHILHTKIDSINNDLSQDTLISDSGTIGRASRKKAIKLMQVSVVEGKNIFNTHPMWTHNQSQGTL